MSKTESGPKAQDSREMTLKEKVEDRLRRLNGGLSLKQSHHLDSIIWLISQDPRHEGRTPLLAQAYIEEAVKHPGAWIHVRDHSPQVEADILLVQRIGQLLDGVHQAFDIDLNGRMFRLKKEVAEAPSPAHQVSEHEV